MKLGRINRNLYNIQNGEDSIKCAISMMSKDDDLKRMSFLVMVPEGIKYIIVPNGAGDKLREMISTTLFKIVKIVEVG
jgi:hypothetical protein